ncbi:MAG: DUF2460 domain-containing protein [Pseudomonadota bacterium]
MAFHDSLFPLDIAFNSEGGPSRRTQITTLTSGQEVRNSPWHGSRRRFNAGYGVKTLKDIETVIAFFEARHGQLHSFRFRDPFDHKSSAMDAQPGSQDQSLGTGDGVRTEFSCLKRYQEGAGLYERIIRCPVVETVQISVDGVAQPFGETLTFDAQSARFIFDQAPAPGVAITAGYIFDVPVRFDTDQLQISLAAFEAGDIPNIPLIEVLE